MPVKLLRHKLFIKFGLQEGGNFGRYTICDIPDNQEIRVDNKTESLGKTVFKMRSQKSTRSTSFVLRIHQRLFMLSCFLLLLFVFVFFFFNIFK